MNKIELLSKALKLSFSYDDYKNHAQRELNSFEFLAADKSEIERNEARKLNIVRMSRIEKQFRPEAKSAEVLENIDQKQLWIVISESWCGDSAQILPVIAKLAFLNPQINLRIIPRDKNPEYMNNYLTDGKRSIPKLIIYDKNFDENATWGPRPGTAQQLMEEMNNNNLLKIERLKKLHLWYSKNKGLEIENEIVEIIHKISGKKINNSHSEYQIKVRNLYNP